MFRVLVAGLLLWTLPAHAIEKCGSGKRVTCIVDGDTFGLEGEKIRAIGCPITHPAKVAAEVRGFLYLR